MGDLSSFNDVLFPDRLQGIYPPSIQFPYLQNLDYPRERSRENRHRCQQQVINMVGNSGVSFLIYTKDGVG